MLNPCSLTVEYLTPASSEGGQDIIISLEEMVFEFSPGLLTTLSNVVAALTGQRKVCPLQTTLKSLHYIALHCITSHRITLHYFDLYMILIRTFNMHAILVPRNNCMELKNDIFQQRK